MSSAVSTESGRCMEHHEAELRGDPLFLDRCQVDTPTDVVSLVWRQVLARRSDVDLVVDFGAGDGRFAAADHFRRYLGYEIDSARCAPLTSGRAARIVPRCAFSHIMQDADVCVGNPPYVRNQDLPSGWREMAASEVRSRTGVDLSGLANAWQYFLMLALWSVKDDGLVALVLPYEWVSRPSAQPIRGYIEKMGWSVDVYRLPDGVFAEVSTAASITVIDKRCGAGWRYYDITSAGEAQALASATGGALDVVPYTRVRGDDRPRAKRGLSPGTQQLFTLTEGERVHAGLHRRSDVVRCVTSLRSVPSELGRLTSDAFEKHFVSRGAKCWLIRTDHEPSPRLQLYLDSVDSALHDTATCRARETWWRFPMPSRAPSVLIAQAFKRDPPKAVLNEVKAHAVGGVAGIYGIDNRAALRFIGELAGAELHQRLVPYANQMRKVEINQINSLLTAIDADEPDNA